MNTKSLLTRIAVPGLALGLLGGLGATLATSASAATLPGSGMYVTHSSAHNDTTNGGAVWAVDNLTEKFTVVPADKATRAADGANYKVTIDVTGSFKGTLDPGRDGTNETALGYLAPLASSGPVKGTISYDVSSVNGPVGASLLPNQAPDTGLRAALGQLFPDGSIVGGGSDYTFSYQNGNYVQYGNGTITGDVTGH
jgi:hypothetical protein